MKPDIYFEPGVSGLYSPLLQFAISDIFSKIDEAYDNSIRWVIFDEHSIQKYGLNLKHSTCIRPIRYRYGFCYPYKKEIWISSQAILSFNVTPWKQAKTLNKLLGIKSNNLLVDVILDELTHIQTLKDHGNPVYDKKLSDYKHRYYAN